MASDEEFSLNHLPFDCIVTICEYLTAEDLIRFGRVCSVFHEASTVSYLWRRLSLGRWLFCNVNQISDGPQRWQRYFTARRSVEAKMDTGKPLRDYRVRTLRGHQSEVVSVVVIGERRGGQGESDVNWESPSNPVVVSLSSDGCVKAWDVIQGKELWSPVEVDGPVTCLTGCESRGEVALSRSDGSVQLWDVDEWTLKATFNISGSVTKLIYASIGVHPLKKSSVISQTFLMVHTLQLELWNCDDVISNTVDKQVSEAVKPVLVMSAPAHINHNHLSLQGFLSFEATVGEIHVFDVPALLLASTPSTPVHPNAKLHTNESVTTSCWVEPRCLATVTRNSVNIDIWDVGSHLDMLAQSRRSVYDRSNIYSPTRSISNETPALCMGVANRLLITGDGRGNLRVIDLKSGNLLQSFQDHKGRITDLYTDRFRVLSCSTDFSIRVYRWLQPGSGSGTSSPSAQLESRYTLLGGSVALKQHDGFNRLLCAASCCVGVAGNQLKFYTFSTNLPSQLPPK